MADLWLAVVLTSVIFGGAGYLYANKTGRNPVKWTILGVVFNIFILAAFIAVGGRSQKAKQLTR